MYIRPILVFVTSVYLSTCDNSRKLKEFSRNVMSGRFAIICQKGLQLLLQKITYASV
jgi:hypothetical protein